MLAPVVDDGTSVLTKRANEVGERFARSVAISIGIPTFAATAIVRCRSALSEGRRADRDHPHHPSFSQASLKREGLFDFGKLRIADPPLAGDVVADAQRCVLDALCSYCPFSNDPMIRLNVLFSMSIAQIGIPPHSPREVADTIMRNERPTNRATRRR
jgi:hypothetical protein